MSTINEIPIHKSDDGPSSYSDDSDIEQFSMQTCRSAVNKQVCKEIGSPDSVKKSNQIVSPSIQEQMDPSYHTLERKVTEVGLFWTLERSLTNMAKNLLIQLAQFYTHERLEKLIVPRSIKALGITKKFKLSTIVNKAINGPSLREIEYLIKNFAKKHKICIVDPIKQQRIDIHQSYQNQLDLFKRPLFDVYCRENPSIADEIRVYFEWTVLTKPTKEKKTIVLSTSVGQLNLIKWLSETGILEFIEKHREENKKDMNTVLERVGKEKAAFKKDGKKRKREQLVHAPDVTCTLYQMKTVLISMDSESENDD